MAKPLAVGAAFPDFKLPGLLLGPDAAHRRDYRLGDAGSRPVVLAFYPGDDTLVCTRQLCSYTSGLERFTELGAEVWGISPQDLDSHERFARKHQLRIPLLTDQGEALAEACGITLPGLGLRRSVFVVDGTGVIRWRHVALAGVTFRSTDALVKQLAALA
ncbi:peroxiredoxin [Kitasatospora sp. NPDC002227]|uniref:peroxiredoxin n=1 Tax=Kitasatospora sp. NPDC002227 TaxID=3154773 RepID=UPI00332BAAC4